MSKERSDQQIEKRNARQEHCFGAVHSSWFKQAAMTLKASQHGLRCSSAHVEMEARVELGSRAGPCGLWQGPWESVEPRVSLATTWMPSEPPACVALGSDGKGAGITGQVFEGFRLKCVSLVSLPIWQRETAKKYLTAYFIETVLCCFPVSLLKDNSSLGEFFSLSHGQQSSQTTTSTFDDFSRETRETGKQIAGLPAFVDNAENPPVSLLFPCCFPRA
jgi:hypothetical protein